MGTQLQRQGLGLPFALAHGFSLDSFPPKTQTFAVPGRSGGVRIRDTMAAAKLGAEGDAVAVEVRLPPLSEADPLHAEKKVRRRR